MSKYHGVPGQICYHCHTSPRVKNSSYCAACRKAMTDKSRSVFRGWGPGCPRRIGPARPDMRKLTEYWDAKELCEARHAVRQRLNRVEGN